MAAVVRWFARALCRVFCCSCRSGLGLFRCGRSILRARRDLNPEIKVAMRRVPVAVLHHRIASYLSSSSWTQLAVTCQWASHLCATTRAVPPEPGRWLVPVTPASALQGEDGKWQQWQWDSEEAEHHCMYAESWLMRPQLEGKLPLSAVDVVIRPQLSHAALERVLDMTRLRSLSVRVGLRPQGEAADAPVTDARLLSQLTVLTSLRHLRVRLSNELDPDIRRVMPTFAISSSLESLLLLPTERAQLEALPTPAALVSLTVYPCSAADLMRGLSRLTTLTHLRAHCVVPPTQSALLVNALQRLRSLTLPAIIMSAATTARFLQLPLEVLHLFGDPFSISSTALQALPHLRDLHLGRWDGRLHMLTRLERLSVQCLNFQPHADDAIMNVPMGERLRSDNLRTLSITDLPAGVNLSSLLGHLRNLSSLSLRDSSADIDPARLPVMHSLTHLNLSSTTREYGLAVTSASFKTMPNLRSLVAPDAPLTFLQEALVGLPRLCALVLDSSAYSAAQVAVLRAAHPHVAIDRSDVCVAGCIIGWPAAPRDTRYIYDEED